MRKTILYFAFALSIIIPMSCEKDFEELNTNPYGSTETDIGPIFNTIVSTLRLGWNEQLFMHNEIMYKQTQLAALTNEAWPNITTGTEEIWVDYYQALAHARVMESLISDMESKYGAERMINIKAMLKIVIAYKTFKLTDLFGGIPYSDAGRGFESPEYARPKFDTQEEIYKSLLNDLEWAAENIKIDESELPFTDFVEFDNILYGDMTMWQKFANSLRLRHAMRMVEKEPELAGNIIKDIIENNLPILEGNGDGIVESVVMLPANQAWNNESVIWSFSEHKHLRMGSNIWHQISENDSSDGSGIFDPRAYIFFDTNNDHEWAAYPQIPDDDTPGSGGIPYGKHRDNNYDFKGPECIYSPFKFYLIRDEYTIPQILITGTEAHFIKAEAYMRGIGVGQNIVAANDEYEEGIRSSVQFWKNIMNNSSIWVNNEIPSNLTTQNLLYKVSLSNASGETEKLKLIYAQRWLDSFRQCWEAYALARRTMLTPREGDDLEYFRFTYPPSEVEYNNKNWLDATSTAGDYNDVKVWWMR